MLHKSIRWLVPVALLGSSYLGYQAIAAHGPVVEEKKSNQSNRRLKSQVCFPPIIACSLPAMVS